ncbi:acetyl-CoA hydrolase/transferase family protein [Porphyromonas cangingivalis]|uniref:acetyl-CoA hydrolase/transferase family protein n=1 Tax=Porphyromonas cangingivalis TaxID=36874 RepID=UPI00051DAAE6|nr:acetyl-CoA hydrolase/transferase C-terminal domain-containing protein [Porphyromonas cangingivalis]KGL49544.1 hypothetical protein HQ34_05350 [Porphyromonas cangingivalis]
MNKTIKLSLSEAIAHVKDGEKIVLGHAAVTPNCLVEELVRQKDRFRDLTLFQMIFLGDPVHVAPECADHMRVVAPFVFGPQMRTAVSEGRAAYIPTHFSYVPSLFLPGGAFEPDWAFVQVTPPDAQGRYSTSLSSDFTLPAARAAKKVMAVVNPALPYIGGDNFLRADEIDIIVEHESAPYTLPASRESEIDSKIADFCAALIPDYATLQMGIGAIPDAVLGKLSDRKDLGIHTEMFTDGVMHLHRKGVITGKYKGVNVGKVTSAFVMGSQALYDYINNNDEFELYPVDYMNNPHVVGENPNFISINSCIEVDLYGQVCAEKVGGKMYSGSGGQLDYLRGVRYSKGGKSILTMPSTAKNDEVSRIAPNLSNQAVVTSHRNDVDYIITEYGVAPLFGRTEAERALALASIAHPKFREGLEREAYARFSIRKAF